MAIAQLETNDERAAPFHRLIDAVCAGADRLSLEVAVAEAISAFALISDAHPGHSRPVRRAMEYLRERLGDSITLDDLADYADLDKFHLCRAFRAQVGMPPHTYLTHLRIARAKELLLRGVRASDVAPLVGLYDQAQLTRHFRRLVGTTPARYGKSPHDPKGRRIPALAAVARAEVCLTATVRTTARQSASQVSRAASRMPSTRVRIPHTQASSTVKHTSSYFCMNAG